MKTKEELLKIYSAYLPYELAMQTQGFHEKKILEGIGNNDHCVFFDNENHWCTVTMSQPILREMDMLTKEIEHKGEKFIPINKLKHFYGWDYLWSYHQKANGDFNIKSVRYACVEKLLEWHFNVFNLSESEYIKKK